MSYHYKLSSFLFLFILFILNIADLCAQGIHIDFGNTRPRIRYLQIVGNAPGEDGQIIGTRIEREYCAKSAGKAMYFAIDNEKLYQRPESTFDIIYVEYFDADEREIKLVYDAVDDPNKVSDTVIKTTGSSNWKSAVFNLEDSYFSDRQKYNADFRLECADTMIINVVRVAPVDYYIDFGETNDEFLIAQKMVQTGDSNTEIVVINGEECISTIEESQYLYCDVNDDEIMEGDFPEFFISVEYFDSSSQLPMRLQYDSESEPYKDMAWIQGKGWGSFKVYTWEVTDGYMAGRQNDGSDFRLNFQQPGPAVNRIMLGLWDYGPSAVQNSTAAVADFKLDQNYPNPFNPKTTIRYHLAHQSHVRLQIYNLKGELIRTLVENKQQAGIYSQLWDGLDDSGVPTSSGLYVYRLDSDGFSQSKKMIKLK